MGAWRRGRRLALVLVLLVLLVVPAAPASAQTTPPVPPPPAPVDWSTIPDLVGYLSLTVPSPVDLIGCEVQPSQESWQDVGYYWRLLIWHLRDLYRQLICFLLNMLQIMLNGLSALINVVLRGLNGIWRLLVFIWSTVRVWLYNAFYLFEIFRDMWRGIEQFIILVNAWLTAALAIILQALGLIAALVVLIGRFVLSLLGAIGWIGAIAIGTLLAIIAQMRGNTVPVQLSDTHPAYLVMRGLLDSFLDSWFGWLFILIFAMAYVAFIFWMSRFLNGNAKES